MKNKTFDFASKVKYPLIVYAAIFLIGIVFTIIFGVNLDINFKGGTRFTYAHTGEISTSEAGSLIESVLGRKVTATESSSLSGDTKKLVISLVADESVSAEMQQNILESLEKQYPDNNIELYDSNSVSPSVAGNFFAKSLVAVVIAAVLVLVYVSLRFKKIGGFSAGVMALAALILDVLTSFFTCIVFRLQIDSNFMAVVLTILGYSLNDTIVIYDRIRENTGRKAHGSRVDVVNLSLTQVMNRTITTTVTTLLAVATIVVVSEICGLTSLRSFAIPMMFGLTSGCISSLCISAPLWVKWQAHKDLQETNGKKQKSKK